MRYHTLLLPALAGLAFADDAVAVADDPAATPDALPFEDLRDIPVPTYTEVLGVTSQDIPYATPVAIAEVASAVAATPLTVFPAATDVPINAAGASDSSSGGGDDASANVIVSTASKLKRALTGVARQPRNKRADCDAQPTIPNVYNVALDTPANFKADPIIASTASNAKVPAGYYQNFKNLGAANNAMNYLGYSVVKTGYDVDWCAAKCDAKDGCLAFNIYFERDPTLKPGPNCPNPDGFANIKCSYWGTGLDESTATNVGQWRAKFWVSIAGSNAYTSYKLDGPVDGWDGPQKLGNAALNAPLWDCENKWSYLGYKLLQAGSVDPRLCAAACDAQTAFNKAHPSNADPYACNAFGSYILTKKNSTGSYQQGQMCTFYTAYWDAKYATNTGASDPKIGATYSYSHSTFYGKQGAQLSCPAGFQSSSGTYIKGGVDKKASLKSAAQIISSSSLQPYCSSILGYTSIPATTTVTTSTAVIPTTVLQTTFSTAETTSTTTSLTTSTVTITTTINQLKKRDAPTDTVDAEALIPTTSTTINGVVLPPLPTLPAELLSNASTIAKRDVSQPSALANFPTDIVSSACAAAVTQATATPTVTSTAIDISEPKITEVVTDVTTVTATVTATSTTLTTAIATANACVPKYKFMVADGRWKGSILRARTPDNKIESGSYSIAYLGSSAISAEAEEAWTLDANGKTSNVGAPFSLATRQGQLQFIVEMSEDSQPIYNFHPLKCTVDKSQIAQDFPGSVGLLSCANGVDDTPLGTCLSTGNSLMSIYKYYPGICTPVRFVAFQINSC